MKDAQCGNKEPHNFHSHVAEIEQVCSGFSTCGTFNHEEHTFVAPVTFWCPGICNCGMYRYAGKTHGPGAHK